MASLATWVYLTFFRAQFWRIHESPQAQERVPEKPPDILALIPARDEASSIADSVTSLLAQDYTGSIRVVVIDDNSSDGTAEIAKKAASEISQSEKLTVISAEPLPRGWTGKIWALAEGLRQAGPITSDYILLTDADIVHSPDSVRELAGRAQSEGFDLVSLMVRLRCDSAAERSLIPAFLFFFFMLYPPAWVGDTRCETAAAAGGCILVSSQALRGIGGIAAIRGELIDDCALAKRVKQNGGRVFLGATAHTRSLRAYPSMCDVEQMIARTAFTQLHHSVVLLIGTLLAMMVVFVAPPLLLFGHGSIFWLGAAAWALMSLCYLPALRLYKLSPLRSPTLPLVALFYMKATLHSAVLYWQGRGGVWKGRVQDSGLA